MKAEIKARWLEALRSGKYKQGQDYLRLLEPISGHSYCCLGVLCDLVRPEGWDRDTSCEGNVGFSFNGGGSDVALPPHLAKEVGFDLSCGDNDGGGFTPRITIPPGHPLRSDGRLKDVTAFPETGVTYLSVLNDRGLSFSEIADLIEQFVEVTP